MLGNLNIAYDDDGDDDDDDDDVYSTIYSIIGYSKENLKIHTGDPSPPSLTLPSPSSPPLPSLPLPFPTFLHCVPKKLWSRTLAINFVKS